MKKRLICFAIIVGMLVSSLVFVGCGGNKTAKIGVSIGAGPATRWDSEKVYMEKKAEELGAEIEVRLNRDDTLKTQADDCRELIDSGIDVLVLTRGIGNDVGEILDYAKEKRVKVVTYARVVFNREVDLFVGYDSKDIGKEMGRFLVETVDSGNYIILQGDRTDNNALLLYDGAMGQIDEIRSDINILADSEIVDWKPENAEKAVNAALDASGNKVDAILAPNDKLAEACRKVLNERNITNKVEITGMDAELEAIRRIARGEQSMTMYLDFKELAEKAIEQADLMARGKKPVVSSKYDNGTVNQIDANLVPGRVIIKQNIKHLVENGLYTCEQVCEGLSEHVCGAKGNL